MPTLLTDDEIATALTRLPQWSRDGDGLVRRAELADFPAAVAAVDRVAAVAERDNHHPDIDIRWRNLTFRCSTHSAGGITELDVALAAEIEHILDA
jgi:4a-hydroxytetrahydrobiopterin dehydratase